MLVLTPTEECVLNMLGRKGKPFTVTDAVQVFTMMANLKGATFVSIVAETVPKMLKTGNPYLNTAVKVATVNGMVNFDYAGAVERARSKEGKEPEFQQGTSWHEPVLIDGHYTPFCKHKRNGDIYLRIKRQSGSSTIIDWNTGRNIEAEVSPFLQVSKRSNQGLDKPVEFLTYGLKNIKAVSVNGGLFVLRA